MPKTILLLKNSMPTILKCKVENEKSPINLHIDYSQNNDIELIDLSIFYSFHT